MLKRPMGSSMISGWILPPLPLASPQQDYGVAHRFLYLVCLAALLSLQVHPAHCNSIDPQRKSNSRMLLLWNCFAALQVHFMHLRSKERQQPHCKWTVSFLRRLRQRQLKLHLQLHHRQPKA